MFVALLRSYVGREWNEIEARNPITIKGSNEPDDDEEEDDDEDDSDVDDNDYDADELMSGTVSSGEDWHTIPVQCRKFSHRAPSLVAGSPAQARSA
jgi:hypothetical protein